MRSPSASQDDLSDNNIQITPFAMKLAENGSRRNISNVLLHFKII